MIGDLAKRGIGMRIIVTGHETAIGIGTKQGIGSMKGIVIVTVMDVIVAELRHA
jgi:hypothetical protein